MKRSGSGSSNIKKGMVANKQQRIKEILKAEEGRYKNFMFGEIVSRSVDELFLNQKSSSMCDGCDGEVNKDNCSSSDKDFPSIENSSSNQAEPADQRFCHSYWDDDDNDEINDCINDMVVDYGIENNEKRTIISASNSCLELSIPSYSVINLVKHLTMLSIQANMQKDDDHSKLMKGGGVTKGSFARITNKWFQENNVTKAARHDFINILHNSFGSSVNLPIRQLTSLEKKAKEVSLFQFGQSIKSSEREDFPAFRNDDECSVNSDNFIIGGRFYRGQQVKDVILREDNNLNSDDSVLNSDDEDDDNLSFASSDESEEINSVSTNNLDDCNVESTIDKYDLKIARFVQIDQCLNDCFVYAGINSKHFTCPECHEIRFRPCCRATCKGRGSSNCEHLLNKDGVAFKQLFYRPLFLLIVDLLRTPHFVTALNYRRKSPSKGFYADLMDGEMPKEHLKEMEQNFNDWQQLGSDIRRRDAISITLLLSEFYDGGQLFKNHASNFWVLMTQILNLPPTYRGKLGIGMFVQAIYAGKHSKAEEFLFKDNFCEELLMLYKGIDIAICGITYFIQARLILHTLDTRAEEAVLSLQSTSNAKAGCPLCRGVTGVHDGFKCVYIGHRHLLPLNHYLRYLGQTGKCCPADFYHPTKERKTKSDWEEEEFLSSSDSFAITDHNSMRKFDNLVREEEKKAKLKNPTMLEMQQNELKSRHAAWEKMFTNSSNDSIFDFCQPCSNDPTTKENIQKFLFLRNEGYDWSHQEKEFDFKGTKITCKSRGLRKYLFYRHFDLRPFKLHDRVSYKEHLKDATEARRLNSMKKSKKLLHVNGIQDVWCFDRLPYADISKQVTWPFVHATHGIIKLLSGIIMGVLPETAATRKIGTKPKKKGETKDQNDDCSEVDNEPTKVAKTLSAIEKNTIFNSYRQVPLVSKEPYEASKDDLMRCREWLQCVILPQGLSGDSCKMNGFVTHDGNLGYMKMNQRLKLISGFWELVILSMNDLADEYKMFYRMIAKDITKLLSFNFNTDSMHQISSDIIESICVWEGLLPAKNCTFQLHELIDMVNFVPLFGPPMGVSEFPGERAVGKMINRKLKSNTGGVSFEKKIIEDQVNNELHIMKSFYENPINSKTERKHSPNSSLHCSIDRTGTMVFNSIPFNIAKPELYYNNEEKYSPLSEYEFESLIETLLVEVKKQFNFNTDQCNENSSVFRVENLRNHDLYTSYEWFQFVCNNNVVGLLPVDCIVAKNLLLLKPQFYVQSYVYGVKFTSRGSWFRETQRPSTAGYGRQEKEYVEAEERAKLIHSWKESRNCWCRFQQHERKHLYGSLNAFFRIVIQDSSLDGLIIASVTSRKYKTMTKSSVDSIAFDGSLDIVTCFIATTDIYPTRIATLPFNSKKLAINLKRSNIDTKFSTSDTSQATYLYMITLQPEKLTLRPVKRPFKDLQL